MQKKKLFFITILSMLLLWCFLPIQHLEAKAVNRNQVLIGDEKDIGNGKIWSWVKLDEQGQPTQIGVTLTEAALTGLPADNDPPQKDSLKLKLMDGGPNYNFEYELLFPEEAETTAYTHVGFNWNPEGHGPPEVFDEPHFDVHFYMADPEYRHQIQAQKESQIKVSNLEPPQEYLPPNYRLARNTAEPRMGSHYADMTSEQLVPGNFSNIFIFGVHNGFILFWEPMITKAYLESHPNFTAELPLPKAYPVSGLYPTAYSVKYDPDLQEYDISLDGLTPRLASYARDIYGVPICLDSRYAKIITEFGEAPENPVVEDCLDILRQPL